MRKGMTLAEGDKLAPVKVRVLRQDQREAWLEMTLVQGLNRQIRRMCRDMGRTVLRLIRVRQGFLELGSLKPGEARQLTAQEVERLRKEVGLPPE
jgi:23S rRNA pseudouridine2605 synthase